MRARKVHSKGPLLRYARLRCVLTQRELAQKAGLSFRSIYRWEHGESRPRPRHLDALFRALAATDIHVAVWLSQRLGVPLPSGLEAPAAPRIEEPPVDQKSLELALFRSAEELDQSPVRLRRALALFLGSAVPGPTSVGHLLRALQAGAGGRDSPT